VPEKDKVQETVSMMKGLQLKKSISKDTTLHFFCVEQWYKGGDADACDGNFGHHQEALSFSRIGHSPGAVCIQERSSKAGKGWSIFA
jgi:hypothetical protein